MAIKFTPRRSTQGAVHFPVRFSGFCQAIGRPRIWRDFRKVRSGDIARQKYIFPDGEQLRGTLLHMGLREIRGSRTLDKLVEVK